MQKDADAHAEADWLVMTAEREVCQAFEPEFTRQVLHRQVSVPPLPRRRHCVAVWPPDEDVAAPQTGDNS